MQPSKTITYRGGLVSFCLPAHWREEYEPEGGGTFYEDRPDSGTLRLNVVSLESKDVPSKQMVSTVFPVGSFTILSNECPIRRSIKEAQEEGHHLHIHSWEIAVPVPPHGMRVICFRHTILANQENDPAIAAELTYLEHCIQAAEFSELAAVSGDYHHG
jgi:hypothetical protein